jgi:hypothetical protein
MPDKTRWVTTTSKDMIAGLERCLESGDEEPVVVFDFDGVLIEPFEDDIYHLPASPNEGDFLDWAAGALGVPTDGLDTPYRRSVLYHEAARLIDRPSPPGHYLPVCRWCSQMEIPWFVLSARSTSAMIWRLFTFLEAESLRPTETFCIGRVSKHLQLDYLRQLYAGPIHYVDDSEDHLAAIGHRGGLEVTLHHAARSSARTDPDILHRLCRSVICTAARAKAQAASGLTGLAFSAGSP